MSENKPFIGAVNVTSSEVKCPGCGGTIGIKYDPESLNLTCPFCGLISKLPQPGTVPVMQEFDFNTALQRASVNWGQVKKLIVCSNCGGQTIYDAEQVTGACPFCGSTSVNPAAENSQIMAPQSIIPFSISKDLAQQHFTNYLKSKTLVKKGATDSILENITGLYLPFWTYDALAISYYHAHHDGGKNMPSYNYQGVLNQFYDDIVIYGSDRIRHPHIRRVQNFDFQRMVPYSPEYLAGIPAERYTVGLNDGWERAKFQITEKIKKALLRKFFMKACVDAINTNYYNVKFRYVLAPIYLASYKYGKISFPVAINGQTGQTYCEAPTYIPLLVVLGVICALVILAINGLIMVLPEFLSGL